jgi:hypothetical protein
MILNMKCVGVNGRLHDFVGRRGFSGLSFPTSDKQLKLVGELFSLPRHGPKRVVRRGSIFRGRRFELDRGHFVNDAQRVGFRW